MGLSVWLEAVRPVSVFHHGITHNLVAMAEEAGIYKHLWRPEEIGIETAQQLIEPLKEAERLLSSDKERFVKFNPSNGWGSYELFVEFVSSYLTACEEYPDAIIKISR